MGGGGVGGGPAQLSTGICGGSAIMFRSRFIIGNVRFRPGHLNITRRGLDCTIIA
jgi:hypothetical protein